MPCAASLTHCEQTQYLCQWEDLGCFLSSCLRPVKQKQPGGKNIWCQDLVSRAGDLEHSVSGEMSPWLGRSSAANLLQTEPDSEGPSVGRGLTKASVHLILDFRPDVILAEQPLRPGKSPWAASALAMHLSSGVTLCGSG